MIRAVDAKDLPVDLPHLEDSSRTAGPSRRWTKRRQEWLLSSTIDGKRYKRETNTMPQWAGRAGTTCGFIDPQNNEQASIDPANEKAWMPVDLYIGGAEHAVLHLLYSRFWHKVLFDRGIVSTPEPFQKLVNQGMIWARTTRRCRRAAAMSINPDDVVTEYGADSLRLFEMFMGPLEAVKPWSMQASTACAAFSTASGG